MSTMRLYGSVIAIVSGIYSISLSTTGMAMTGLAWFMLVLGVIFLVHGILLVTPAAGRMGGGSGIAMIVYSVLMILNQGWMGTMGGPVGMMGGPMTAGMGWSPGMLAIAVLMLASGIIMTSRRDMM